MCIVQTSALTARSIATLLTKKIWKIKIFFVPLLKLKTMKKKITFKDLVAMDPCYHPSEIGIPENYSATVADFIKEYREKVKNKENIIWVLCRNDYMTDRDMRLFAVWCAREALKLVDNPDQRSIDACDVAERYANGDATDEELVAARGAAWAACAARAALAASAACAASRASSASSASSAAGDAARDARAAAWVALDAGWSGLMDKQIDKLITYFNK